MRTIVSVEHILKTVEASCDFDYVEFYPGTTEDEQRTNFWVDVITRKASDTGFGHLVDSILENGWDEASCIGWDEDEKSITEGHHRLVAAILLCMDEVPVHPWGHGGNYHLSAHWDDDVHSIEVPISVPA